MHIYIYIYPYALHILIFLSVLQFMWGYNSHVYRSTATFFNHQLHRYTVWEKYKKPSLYIRSKSRPPLLDYRFSVSSCSFWKFVRISKKKRNQTNYSRQTGSIHTHPTIISLLSTYVILKLYWFLSSCIFGGKSPIVSISQSNFSLSAILSLAHPLYHSLHSSSLLT